MENANIFIEINIEDDGRFTDVALLVDKDDFLNKVAKLRKKYADRYKVNLPTNDYSIVNEELLNEVKHDVENLRRRFNRPLHFLRAITKSILNGIVEEDDYSKAFLERKALFTYNNREGTPDIKYSIIIFPGTRKKDVDQVFFQFSEEVKANIGLKTKTDKDTLLYGYWYDPYFRKPFDTKTSIRQIREWYIRNKRNEKPLWITLKDLDLTYEEYRKIYKIYKRGVVARGKDVTEEMYHSYIELLNKIDKYRNNVKEQLKRYRKLFVQS